MFSALWMIACVEPTVPTAPATDPPSLVLREVATPHQSVFCANDPLTAVEITSLAPSGGAVVFGTRFHGRCDGRVATVWSTGMTGGGVDHVGGYPPVPASGLSCDGAGSEASVFGLRLIQGRAGFSATASTCATPDMSWYAWSDAQAATGWSPTGLGPHLAGWYGDSGAALTGLGLGGHVCGENNMPCQVVAVEPAGGDRGPTLWTGPGSSDSVGPTWLSEPVLDLSGVTAPVAASISALSRGHGGLLFGTSVTGLEPRLPDLADGDCADPASPTCPRPRLLRLDHGVLLEAWRGEQGDPPVVAIADHSLGGAGLAWAITDAPARVFDLHLHELLAEEDASQLAGPGTFHPTFLRPLLEAWEPNPQRWPEVTTLLAGGYADGAVSARLAWRCLDRPGWRTLEIPDTLDRSDTPDFDEAAILAAELDGDELVLSLGRVTGPAPEGAAGRIVAVSGIRELCE